MQNLIAYVTAIVGGWGAQNDQNDEKLETDAISHGFERSFQ